MKDIKYLTAYIIPLLAITGLLYAGIWAYATIIFSFGLVPLLDPVLPNSPANYSDSEKKARLSRRFFDWLLYLNLPIVYGVVFFFLWRVTHVDFSTTDLIGQVLSVGIVIGTCGINVAHELGHREDKTSQVLAKMLLLPALYMHFFIEHNRGHHKYVATDRDPASAKFGEMVFVFWFRSVIGSYRSAWHLEKERLSRTGRPFWSIKNEMLVFQVIQLAYLAVLYLGFGSLGLYTGLLAGVVGFLLLETINYIEHYGLRRIKNSSGRYEVVRPIHSWNSNFELGRIILYELTRHSDHHFLATKKYQVLDHHDQSPQLPMGYPASMLLSMLPPLWFAVMNPRIRRFAKNLES